MELKMAITTNNPRLFRCYGNLFPNPVEYGIFNGLNAELTLLQIPNYNLDSLNLLYFQRSKDKRLSDIVNTLIDIYGLVSNDSNPNYYTISSGAYAKLITMITTKNLYNWSKLVDTYKKEYDMISPFKMVVDDHSTDELESEDSAENSSQSSETTKGDYQGFNSNDYNPVDKNTIDGSDSSSRSSNYTRTNEHQRDTVRYGNIGNRSSQELIKEERGLWVWNIYNQIFSDIDKVLTKGIY